MMLGVAHIRALLKLRYQSGILAEDGNVEIINASFMADEPTIFGEVNHDWCNRELAWYKSESLSVHAIEPPVPRIWQQVASAKGEINSNYGWCIWSDANGKQFDNAIKALVANRNSRQATMIYIRPSMHEDATRDGMRDFMCTYSTQLMIRDNRLHYMVFMRSNDAVFGYKGDRFWHDHVHDLALNELWRHYPDLEKGNLYWNVGSLHVYPRHFHLIK